jgi:hypothetical protein
MIHIIDIMLNESVQNRFLFSGKLLAYALSPVKSLLKASPELVWQITLR